VRADSVRCPHCARPTAEEHLRCIFCGERLDVQSGFVGRFRSGAAARWISAAIGLALIWVLVRRFL
jgi:hypothetical protein